MFVSKSKYRRNSQGFSIIEVILAIAIFGMLATTLLGVFWYSEETSSLNQFRSQAIILAEEGLEATRNLRDSDYTNLSNGTHGLDDSSGEWQFSGSSDTYDNFYEREVEISSAGSNRKEVVSRVTWQQNAQRTGLIELSTYLSDWRSVSALSWLLATLESSFNLTVANSGNDTDNSLSIATAGNYVYLGRVNGAGREFFIFDISNPASPSLVGQRDLNGNPNDIAISGNYAYIASTDNSSELQIIDVSVPADIALAGKLTVVNLTNANSGDNNSDARAIAAAGGYLFMARAAGDEFLVFNLSSPSAPGNPVGRTNTPAGTFYDLVVSGNYAYLATGDNNNELQVMDVSTKTAPTRVGNFNLNSGDNNADALSLSFGLNNYLYIGRTAVAAAPELYSINIGTPTAPTLAATLEIGYNVSSLAWATNGNYLLLATTSTVNFKVVDGNNGGVLAAPVREVDTSNNPIQVAYSSSKDRAVLCSSDNTYEFQIVKPQ